MRLMQHRCVRTLVVLVAMLPALAIACGGGSEDSGSPGQPTAEAVADSDDTRPSADAELARAFVDRSVAQLAVGRIDVALADATRAIELDPTLAVAYANRAIAHSNLGNFDPALVDLGQAIDLDPRNGRFVALRGFLHCALGDIDLARDDWDVARSLIDDPAARVELDAQIAATSC